MLETNIHIFSIIWNQGLEKPTRIVLGWGLVATKRTSNKGPGQSLAARDAGEHLPAL